MSCCNAPGLGQNRLADDPALLADVAKPAPGTCCWPRRRHGDWPAALRWPCVCATHGAIADTGLTLGSPLAASNTTEPPTFERLTNQDSGRTGRVVGMSGMGELARGGDLAAADRLAERAPPPTAGWPRAPGYRRAVRSLDCATPTRGLGGARHWASEQIKRHGQRSLAQARVSYGVLPDGFGRTEERGRRAGCRRSEPHRGLGRKMPSRSTPAPGWPIASAAGRHSEAMAQPSGGSGRPCCGRTFRLAFGAHSPYSDGVCAVTRHCKLVQSCLRWQTNSGASVTRPVELEPRCCWLKPFCDWTPQPPNRKLCWLQLGRGSRPICRRSIRSVG